MLFNDDERHNEQALPLKTPMATRNADWDRDPAGYDDLRDRQGWINRRRTLFLCDWLERNAPAGHILELGSGTGRLAVDIAANLPRLRWTGVDPLPAYITFARDKAAAHGLQDRVRFIEGQAENLAALAEAPAFDAVISNDVLHHIDDLEQAARAVAAVTRPGAFWCAIEPNAQNPYAFFNQWRRANERNFWPNAFLCAAQTAGWALQERRTIFLIPPLIPHPGPILKTLERYLEGVPFLGGGIVLVLRRV